MEVLPIRIWSGCQPTLLLSEQLQRGRRGDHQDDDWQDLADALPPKSAREISRTTSLSRNTVRKDLRAEQADVPKDERVEKSTKLTPFCATIAAALKADARRPKRERQTALALFEQTKSENYDGCNSRLTDFIRT